MLCSFLASVVGLEDAPPISSLSVEGSYEQLRHFQSIVDGKQWRCHGANGRRSKNKSWQRFNGSCEFDLYHIPLLFGITILDKFSHSRLFFYHLSLSPVLNNSWKKIAWCNINRLLPFYTDIFIHIFLDFCFFGVVIFSYFPLIPFFSLLMRSFTQPEEKTLAIKHFIKMVEL